MTEDEAHLYLAERNVSRETQERLAAFVALLRAENEHQNLIAASTLAEVWSRHIVDSAQLIALAPERGVWIDLGSGPGFPGLIVAALANRRVDLIEERSKRVAFLHAAAQVLAVDVVIHAKKAERVACGEAAVISARAFAPLPRLFAAACHLAGPRTCWILPKGRSAVRELEAARATWQGEYRIVPSVTDPEGAIIVARNVRPGEDR